jgi:ABC-type transport system substrate-binding protein
MRSAPSRAGGALATGAGWIVPKKYVERVGNEGFKNHPIGLGPYRFVSHQPGLELVLEANTDYWRKTPSVKRLVLKSIPEATTRLAMLKKREVDVAYALLGPLAEEVQRGPNLELDAARERRLRQRGDAHRSLYDEHRRPILPEGPRNRRVVRQAGHSARP